MTRSLFLSLFCAAMAVAALPVAATAQEDDAGAIDSVWQITPAERDRFAQAIGDCWTVEPHYNMVTVRVRFRLDRRGFVIDNYIELLETRGGDAIGQRDAYEAVRTAILRCEGRGYDLPDEKYEVWEEVEMSFDGRNARPTE